VEDAVAYTIAVFEEEDPSAPTTYAEMALSKAPVLEQDIPDRALSWAPSANRCLCGGAYVWYVGAVSVDNAVEWSEGKTFTVNALCTRFKNKPIFQLWSWVLFQ